MFASVNIKGACQFPGATYKVVPVSSIKSQCWVLAEQLGNIWLQEALKELVSWHMYVSNIWAKILSGKCI